MRKMITAGLPVMAGLMMMIAQGAAQQQDQRALPAIESPRSSHATMESSTSSSTSGKNPSDWMTASDYQILDELNQVDGSMGIESGDTFIYDTLDWNELESSRPFQADGSTRLSIVEQLDNLLCAMMSAKR